MMMVTTGMVVAVMSMLCPSLKGTTAPYEGIFKS
jgi:hypothetical protein